MKILLILSLLFLGMAPRTAVVKKKTNIDAGSSNSIMVPFNSSVYSPATNSTVFLTGQFHIVGRQVQLDSFRIHTNTVSIKGTDEKGGKFQLVGSSKTGFENVVHGTSLWFYEPFKLLGKGNKEIDEVMIYFYVTTDEFGEITNASASGEGFD